MATRPWVTITARDLEESRHATLVEAARRQAKGRGQPDPVPDLILRTVDELRGAIGFSGAYQLSSDETKLPPNLVDLAVNKIARRIMPRLERSLSDDDKAEEREYQQRLKDLNAGQWPVDRPTDAGSGSPSAQNTTGAEIITPNATTRTFTRGSMNGL